ncbi:MAG: hypothetical protein K9M84_01085 [Spirochaetia bacterium]|nr:hypothetical protein [Spirochaetia bacterium]
MPTYDYRCETCGYEFEHFQMMSEEPLSDCPKCGSPVRRLIGGGIGVIFKGSGFYVNDSKSANSAAAPAPAAPVGEKTGTDSKPAAPSKSAGEKTTA